MGAGPHIRYVGGLCVVGGENIVFSTGAAWRNVQVYSSITLYTFEV